ncbi:DNA metabolism protein [Lithospermum erythrorhizon]|uniref:DNA metabolism protein n=1 Tax=Lithospermum erythrorhizon TaxID=34254 RepID=A0AAV3NUW5_LITER
MTNTEAEAEKAAVNGGSTVEPSVELNDLPKTIIRRIVKDKLSQLSKESEISVQREALVAFSESSRIFIHYLSATANDICKEAKRQTVNAEDVFKALEEMEFSDFVGPLRASLEEVRKNNAGKKSESLKAKESKDKGKRKESPARNCNGTNAENGDGEDDSSD